MTKTSKKKLMVAIENTGGIVELIIKKVGISRVAYWKWEQKYPELIEARDAERMRQVDISEVNLFQANKNGEKWATNKILRTLGRDRGYMEKSETIITGKLDTYTDVHKRIEIYKKELGAEAIVIEQTQEVIEDGR